jgi:nucleoid-associated protein YgaU
VAVLGATTGLAMAAALLVGSGLSRWTQLRTTPSPSWRPDQLIGTIACLTAGALLGWLAIGGVVAVAAMAPTAGGRTAARLAARMTPRLLRTLVAAAVGGTITFASASSALAAPPAPRATSAATSSPASRATSSPVLTQLPEPGWTPAVPPAPPTTRPADVSLVSAAGGPPGSDDAPVVVRRGDTLWAIAARHLPSGADPAQIAREWPRWHAANRAVIGADPDLLQPGQELTPPPSR